MRGAGPQRRERARREARQQREVNADLGLRAQLERETRVASVVAGLKTQMPGQVVCGWLRAAVAKGIAGGDRQTFWKLGSLSVLGTALRLGTALLNPFG